MDYSVMVDRLYNILHEAGVHSDQPRQRLTLPPPKFVRQGRTIIWVNFHKTCQDMNREVDHFKKFIEKELMIKGSLNHDNSLIMKIRAQPSQFESLMYKYVKGYVQCGVCKEGNSTLTKDPTTRIWFISCNDCLTKRAIEPL